MPHQILVAEEHRVVATVRRGHYVLAHGDMFIRVLKSAYFKDPSSTPTLPPRCVWWGNLTHGVLLRHPTLNVSFSGPLNSTDFKHVTAVQLI